MFKRLTHAQGVVSDTEILFSTPFNYLFPDAARSKPCLLPQGETTRAGLLALGQAMADNGSTTAPITNFDSAIPAAFTYLGQFIDHDLTARTDRDSPVTSIGNGEVTTPIDPDTVVAKLRNGRRPQFDLDSVFGDGPGLAGSVAAFKATTQSQALYEPATLKMKVFEAGGRVDLPGREKKTGLDGKTTFEAIVADMRNDENVNVSQLHSAFLKFYNAIYDVQAGTPSQRYRRARQLTRWAYQFIVANDYLPTVCDRDVVADTIANGPRFFGDMAGRSGVFMPLEFSVAGFRFAHSMIRPFYKINATSGDVPLLQMLGVNGNAANFDPVDNQFIPNRIIQWKNYVGGSAQKARKIDTKIAHDLFTLPFRPDDPVLMHLARSNLFRGYSLSIPTGQAMCDGFGVDFLSPAQILAGEDPAIAAVVETAYFHHRTPLWYYVLRESALQQNGERLGELGSRIVSETMIGSLKQDPNSYWNNANDPAVKTDGIDVKPGPGGKIQNLVDLLKFAGFSLT